MVSPSISARLCPRATDQPLLPIISDEAVVNVALDAVPIFCLGLCEARREVVRRAGLRRPPSHRFSGDRRLTPRHRSIGPRPDDRSVRPPNGSAVGEQYGSEKEMNS